MTFRERKKDRFLLPVFTEPALMKMGVQVFTSSSFLGMTEEKMN
jgi:hypothetical protein